MTTTDHSSGLPEQEPTSPTVAVLCDGATWAKTGADWESPRHFCSWGGLRNLAADRGGAALFDLADLPTGLTGEIRKTFPEVFADDRVTARWKSGDSDDVWAELLRVACMDGAHVVGTKSGVTYSGLAVAAHSDHISIGCTSTGRPALAITPRGADWAITVTAPKPVEPGADIPDEVVEAALDSFMNALLDGHERPKGLKVHNFMRAALATADAKRAELAGGVA